MDKHDKQIKAKIKDEKQNKYKHKTTESNKHKKRFKLMYANWECEKYTIVCKNIHESITKSTETERYTYDHNNDSGFRTHTSSND